MAATMSTDRAVGVTTGAAGDPSLATEMVIRDDLAEAKTAELIIVRNHQPLTTSLIISQQFGRRHGDVLRAIANLVCSDGFRRRNFASTSYPDDQDRQQPLYHITRPGFEFLVMGFTGRKAAAWKERFIEAFHAMEQVLERQRNVEWQLQRAEGKEVRTGLTDSLQRLNDYARAHGSTHTRWFYANYTKMLNRALFDCVDLPPGAFRDSLDRDQLAMLRVAETMISRLVDELIAAGAHYKDIYVAAKERAASYAAVVGRSTVLAVAAPSPSLVAAVPSLPSAPTHTVVTPHRAH